MVKDIVKDKMFLANKASECSKEDLYIAQELIDTLEFHRKYCGGLAANMIGYNKRMLVYRDMVSGKNEVLINPVIVETKGEPYKTKECCLCYLDEDQEGIETSRYRVIVVEYYDLKFNKKIKRFRDLTAQVIQHEMDHFEGILI